MERRWAGAVALVALAACGGDGGWPLGADTVPATGASTTATAPETSTAPTTAAPTTAAPTTAAPTTAAATTATATAVPTTTTTTVAATTTLLPTTTVAPSTPAAFTTPLTTVGITTTTDTPNGPALFVDVAATPGLEDLAAGQARPVEQVVTELDPGPLVLPAGARMLDVEITVGRPADHNLSGASARTDRVRSAVTSTLTLEELRARFHAALATIAPYTVNDAELAAPAVGVTMTAAALAPEVPAWTITLTADPTRPGAWIVDVQRQQAVFPDEPAPPPLVVAAGLTSPQALLDALQWQADGWYYRHAVDAVTGAPVTSRRLTFASNVADPVEAAGALGMSLPGAVREDLDADTASFLAPDGARWVIGEGGGTATVRGSVTLEV